MLEVRRSDYINMAYPEDRYISVENLDKSADKLNYLKKYVVGRLNTIGRQRKLLFADKDMYSKEVFESELLTTGAERNELITILQMLDGIEELNVLAEEGLI